MNDATVQIPPETLIYELCCLNDLMKGGYLSREKYDLKRAELFKRCTVPMTEDDLLNFRVRHGYGEKLLAELRLTPFEKNMTWGEYDRWRYEQDRAAALAKEGGGPWQKGPGLQEAYTDALETMADKKRRTDAAKKSARSLELDAQVRAQEQKLHELKVKAERARMAAERALEKEQQAIDPLKAIEQLKREQQEQEVLEWRELKEPE